MDRSLAAVDVAINRLDTAINRLDTAINRVAPLSALLDSLISRIAPHGSAAAWSCCAAGIACANLCLYGSPCTSGSCTCWTCLGCQPSCYHTFYSNTESDCSNGRYNGCVQLISNSCC